MLRLAYFLVTIQLFGLTTSTVVRAEKVERSGKELRTSSRKPTRSRIRSGVSAGRSRSGRRHRAHPSRQDGETGAALAVLAAYAIASPFTIPSAALTHHYPDYHGVPDEPYSPHPKRDSKGTLASPDNNLALRLGAQFTLRPREQNKYGQDRGNVVGALTARLDFRNRMTIAGEYRQLVESPLSRSDRAWAGLGELTALWRFAESPRIRFYTGAGYGNWIDQHGPVHGLLFHYSFEVYPVSPVAFGSHVAVGPLGQSYALRWKTHLSFVIRHIELQFAYDHINVAGVQYGGPMVGVQLHI